jgi:hypothetical protein
MATDLAGKAAAQKEIESANPMPEAFNQQISGQILSLQVKFLSGFGRYCPVSPRHREHEQPLMNILLEKERACEPEAFRPWKSLPTVTGSNSEPIAGAQTKASRIKWITTPSQKSTDLKESFSSPELADGPHSFAVRPPRRGGHKGVNRPISRHSERKEFVPHKKYLIDDPFGWFIMERSCHIWPVRDLVWTFLEFQMSYVVVSPNY